MTFRAAFYKSTHSGLPGIYNRAVRFWTLSQYSHTELIFSDGIAASSSFMDGGVRFKQIDFDPDKWDFIELPDHLEAAARQWFIDHEGEAYDLLGNIHFIFGPVRNSQSKWFCDEAMGASLGILEPWRYDPAILYNTLEYTYGTN